MKWKIVLISLFVMSFSAPTQAQFFKKLGKKAKEKAKERIERKEDKTIDKGLDKTEESIDKTANEATKSGKTSKEDTSGQDAPPGIPGQQGNPMDASQAAGAGEKTDDKDVEITGTGSDLYLEYTMKVDADQAVANFSDFSLKLYSSADKHKGRSDISFSIPMLGTMTNSTLVDLNKRNEVTVINNKNKTYSILDFKNDGDKEEVYHIKTLGKETVHGMSCTHVQVDSDQGYVFELWTSRDFPGYENMLKIYQSTNQMGNDRFWRELVEADSDGFAVKMISQQKGVKVSMDLTKIKKTEFPASTFKVPEGYTKTKQKLPENPFMDIK